VAVILLSLSILADCAGGAQSSHRQHALRLRVAERTLLREARKMFTGGELSVSNNNQNKNDENKNKNINNKNKNKNDKKNNNNNKNKNKNDKNNNNNNKNKNDKNNKNNNKNKNDKNKNNKNDKNINSNNNDNNNKNKHAYAGTSDCFTHLRALLVLQAPRHWPYRASAADGQLIKHGPPPQQVCFIERSPSL
jgi:hypothetical protein